jgi:hypothetical protein
VHEIHLLGKDASDPVEVLAQLQRRIQSVDIAAVLIFAAVHPGRITFSHHLRIARRIDVRGRVAGRNSVHRFADPVAVAIVHVRDPVRRNQMVFEIVPGMIVRERLGRTRAVPSLPQVLAAISHS